MKNVLIWGAGKRGQEYFNKLLKYQNAYNIVGFGDSDINKVGKIFCGKPVLGSSMLERDRQIDLICIASSASREIREQLVKFVEIPIFDEIDQLILPRVSIDISGFCNAKCRWCVTGRKKSEGGSIENSQYMNYDSFIHLYEYLISELVIVPDTEIMLYSWGEPLLNPDYVRIVEYLAEKKQLFSVSTNASVAPLAKKKDAYESCVSFTFSMSGFSQQSYDRIHRLQFENVRENIKKLTDNMYACGFHGDGSLSWHVYKFNMSEMVSAREFAKSLNLRFNAYYPYFNGLSLAQKYLEGQLADEQDEIEKDFILGHVDELLGQRPRDYRCYLENIISIDYKGRVVLCCASDEDCKDFLWIPVPSLNELWTLRRQMMQCDTCKMCRKLHFDYWIANNLGYDDYLHECEEMK